MLCSANNIFLSDNYLLYVPYLLGGLSPTIASFIVLKKNKKVKNFKEWRSEVFNLRHSIMAYLMVLGLAVVHILPQCLISGYEKGAPLFAIIFMIPMMLLGGGLEEAGWRYVLQPELEEKFGFTVSTIIVGIIWWLWHLPLFYIKGVAQYGTNFWGFGINILGLSFALATIRRNTGSVWLCVLFHCIINSLSGIYIIGEGFLGKVVATMALVVVSYVLLSVQNKKNKLLRSKQKEIC